MDHVIVLDGATGSGKSTLLDYARTHPTGRFAVPKKLTTRERRPTDNDWEFSFRSHVSEREGMLVWNAVGAAYGIDLDEIRCMNDGVGVAVLVCTDVDVINRLRAHFDVVHLYVYRHLTSPEIDSLLRTRGSSAQDVASRMQEVARVPDDYLERLDSISSTLLNVSAVESLYNQFDALTLPS